MKAKKISAVLMAIIFLACMIHPQMVFAGSTEKNIIPKERIISSSTQYYDDGSYTVIELSIIDNPDIVNDSSFTRDTHSITGSRTATHYDSSHNKMYALKVYGTFLYDNSTVSCSGRSYQSYIYDNVWTVENVTTSAGGSGTTKASATASGTAKKHFFGITVQTASISVTVYCDKNGNLS